MDIYSKEHLKEELLAVATRKSLKTYIENVNEDLLPHQHINVNESLRELLRALMLVDFQVLKENFIATFEELYDQSSEEVENEEENDDEEEE